MQIARGEEQADIANQREIDDAVADRLPVAATSPRRAAAPLAIR